MNEQQLGGFSRIIVLIAMLLGVFQMLAGCTSTGAAGSSGAAENLRSIATSDDLLWTGVALSSDGRVFVNYPRWYPDRYAMAVAEVVREKTDTNVPLPIEIVPYPNAERNEWSFVERSSPEWREWMESVDRTHRADVEQDRVWSLAGPSVGGWRERFVAVQSVHIDRQNRMWVLDTGEVSRAHGRRAVVYEIDLKTDAIRRVLPLSFDNAPEGSYLNDIRVSPDGGHAFISESGLGAIIVLDVNRGTSRRVLADHPSTKGSADRTPIVEGSPWLLRETGEPLVVHCDGIAVSPDGKWVYYQAISADRLYRVPVASLVDERISAKWLAGAVEDMGESVVTDGMIFDDAGNLYFSALEENAIIYRTPEGAFETLVQDPMISWPDSFAIDRENGLLVFTTAQIHRSPNFNEDGAWPSEPFRVMSHPLAPWSSGE